MQTEGSQRFGMALSGQLRERPGRTVAVLAAAATEHHASGRGASVRDRGTEPKSEAVGRDGEEQEDGEDTAHR